MLIRNDIDSLKNDSTIEFKKLNTYVSARRSTFKCFTFDVPMKQGIQIREISMRLNASIFSFGLSPSQFYLTLTYHKQFLHASVGKQIRIPKESSGASCYKFEIHVGSMKVFKRRDKTKNPCNMDWKRHDENHLKYIIDKVGCNPGHWKIESSDLPFCSVPEQYLELKKQLYQKDGFMPPCRSIEKLTKRTKGTNMWKSCLRRKSFLDLKFYLDEENFYEEVNLVPAYSLQNLVGNAGKKIIFHNHFRNIYIISHSIYLYILNNIKMF